LSLLVLIADRIWEKGAWTYLEVYSQGYDPMLELDHGEPEYDSEDEPINTDYRKERYRLMTYQIEVFCSYYSGGTREGISAIVREALFQRILPQFNYSAWLTTIHDTWGKRCVTDSGQTKIFLSSLRAFDKLSPGRITVLVIGSGSHPIRSGYTYPALARFLSLSGFTGVMHLFDPLENHISCEVMNFRLEYFPMKFSFGSTYEIEEACPTVILDDLYGVEGDEEVIISAKQIESLVVAHRTSRISVKYRADVKPLSFKGVQSCVCTQYSYTGSEKRVYYRVPTNSITRIGQWVGNMQCSECWYYAGLISRIGCPQEDLMQYWRILYSLSGHHCTPVSGIKNLMVLNALKHEVSRGHSKGIAIANVAESYHHPRYAMNYKKIERVYDFVEKVDDQFIQLERNYPPNYDMNFSIRDKVGVNQIVEILSDQNVQFNIYASEGYSKRKYEQVLELYAEVDREYLQPVDIILYDDGPVRILDSIVFCEDVRKIESDGFDSVYSVGPVAILIREDAHRGIRFLFDRGRYIDDEYAYEEE